MNFFIFLLILIGLALVFSAYWLKRNLALENFSQIVFHWKFPVATAGGDGLVWLFILHNILPAALIAAVFAFWRETWAAARFLQKKIFAFLKLLCTRYAAPTRLVVAFLIFGLCLNLVINKLQLKYYIKEQKNISTLYEEHYKDFDESVLKDFAPTQNLVVIFAESFPSALSQYSIPQKDTSWRQVHLKPEEIKKSYAPHGNIAPRLEKLALEHINFSESDAVGGFMQLNGTGWTVAGIAALLCGVPLNVPPNSFKPDYFLKKATCVPDVLAKLGYTQAYLSGTRQELGGKELFEAHGTKVQNLQYFAQQKAVPDPLPKDMTSVGGWGLNDKLTFDLAQKEIEKLARAGKPFALYISTTDTHGEIFLPARHACGGEPQNLLDVFKCTDKVTADFVEFLQKSEIAKNTSIVILGDHMPRPRGFFPPETPHGVLNIFINTPFEKSADKKKTKHRHLSHFDMAPLLLYAVGIPNKALGLGRNPFEGPSLLESQFSIKELNDEIRRGNKMYDSFWQP